MLWAAHGPLQVRPLRLSLFHECLGIPLETDCGLKGAVDVMGCVAGKAMSGVVRQAQDRDIQQVSLHLILVFKAFRYSQ